MRLGGEAGTSAAAARTEAMLGRRSRRPPPRPPRRRAGRALLAAPVLSEVDRPCLRACEPRAADELDVDEDVDTLKVAARGSLLRGHGGDNRIVSGGLDGLVVAATAGTTASSPAGSMASSSRSQLHAPLLKRRSWSCLRDFVLSTRHYVANTAQFADATSTRGPRHAAPPRVRDALPARAEPQT